MESNNNKIIEEDTNNNDNIEQNNNKKEIFTLSNNNKEKEIQVEIKKHKERRKVICKRYREKKKNYLKNLESQVICLRSQFDKLIKNRNNIASQTSLTQLLIFIFTAKIPESEKEIITQHFFNPQSDLSSHEKIKDFKNFVKFKQKM